MKHWTEWIKDHPQVDTWLQNRAENTKRNFAASLQKFCATVNMQPEQWRELDKFKARDLAWKFIQPYIKDKSAMAQSHLLTLKSWYRNRDGEQLPFDSSRGGKHYFKVKPKRIVYEHVPNKKEFYQIVDMASSLRDKALLLFLFQSGCRVNVLEHIPYGHVADQVDNELTVLKITGELDHKLRGRNIPFYYTFLNGEATETLRNFCKVKHKESTAETPLFYTRGKKAVSQPYVWKIVNMCVERAGFKSREISTHTIRKAFRKIVRQTDIDDDTKEMLMGHIIPGSRENYFDRKDLELIRTEYLRCNFSRILPQSETTKMQKKIEELETENLTLTQRLDNIEQLLTSRNVFQELAELRNEIKRKG